MLAARASGSRPTHHLGGGVHTSYFVKPGQQCPLCRFHLQECANSLPHILTCLPSLRILRFADCRSEEGSWYPPPRHRTQGLCSRCSRKVAAAGRRTTPWPVTSSHRSGAPSIHHTEKLEATHPQEATSQSHLPHQKSLYHTLPSRHGHWLCSIGHGRPSRAALFLSLSAYNT